MLSCVVLSAMHMLHVLFVMCVAFCMLCVLFCVMCCQLHVVNIAVLCCIVLCVFIMCCKMCVMSCARKGKWSSMLRKGLE